MTTIDQLTDNLRQTVKTGNLTRQSLPLCPDVSLYLISEDYPKDQLPHKEMLAIMEQPAYWSFCWASGQVLAAYMLSQTELCRGKNVLDLGAGSGVVGIAAAKAGAANVIACDIDPFALDASCTNASLNGVTIDLLNNLARLPERVDLLIAADALYDRDNLPWLTGLHHYADEILIADSRIRDKTLFSDYQHVAEQQATTIPDLDELKEFGDVSIYYSTNHP